MNRSAMTTVLLTFASLTATTAGVAVAAGRDGRDYVIDSLRAAPRTGLLGQCIRTGVPDAGTLVEDCTGKPTAEDTAKGKPAAGNDDRGGPRPGEPAQQAAPADSSPASGATPARASEEIAVPPAPATVAEPPADVRERERADAATDSDQRRYDEEARPERGDGIDRTTVNPDFDKEDASAGNAAGAASAAPTPAEPAAPEREPAPAAPPPAVPAAPPAAAPVPAPAPRKSIAHVTLSAATDFDFDKSTLRPAGKAKLDKLADDLKSVDFSKITVVGHTDRIGSRSYNLKLSRRRADTVKRYLLTKYIQPSVIEASGVGPDQPVTRPGDCKSLKRKALIRCLQPDRRVEVDVEGTRMVEQ